MQQRNDSYVQHMKGAAKTGTIFFIIGQVLSVVFRSGFSILSFLAKKGMNHSSGSKQISNGNTSEVVNENYVEMLKAVKTYPAGQQLHAFRELHEAMKEEGIDYFD